MYDSLYSVNALRYILQLYELQIIVLPINIIKLNVLQQKSITNKWVTSNCDTTSFNSDRYIEINCTTDKCISNERFTT